MSAWFFDLVDTRIISDCEICPPGASAHKLTTATTATLTSSRHVTSARRHRPRSGTPEEARMRRYLRETWQLNHSRRTGRRRRPEVGEKLRGNTFARNPTPWRHHVPDAMYVTRNNRNCTKIQNTFHSKSKLNIALILSQYWSYITEFSHKFTWISNVSQIQT